MALLTDTRECFEETGSIAKFTGRFFSHELKPEFELRQLVVQYNIIGHKILPLVNSLVASDKYGNF